MGPANLARNAAQVILFLCGLLTLLAEKPERSDHTAAHFHLVSSSTRFLAPPPRVSLHVPSRACPHLSRLRIPAAFMLPILLNHLTSAPSLCALVLFTRRGTRLSLALYSTAAVQSRARLLTMLPRRPRCDRHEWVAEPSAQWRVR